MVQEKLIEKIIEEITDRYPVEVAKAIVYYTNLAYTAGWEEKRLSYVAGHYKAVVQLDKFGKAIEMFKSAAYAGRKLNISSCGITKCCNGYRNKAGGYGWKFAGEYKQITPFKPKDKDFTQELIEIS